MQLPRTIKAIYPGMCQGCGERFPQGAKIKIFGKVDNEKLGRKTMACYHPACLRSLVNRTMLATQLVSRATPAGRRRVKTRKGWITL